MKKLLFFSFASFLFNFSFGQTSSDQKARTEALNDPKFIEFKAAHDARVKANGGEVAETMYFGFDDKLKAIFIDGVISSQTPKSNGFATKKEYLTFLNDWISKNQHLLKPEQKKSLITE